MVSSFGKISVALATFNGEKYICEQLESIARQTRSPDEIVISDDGSTDGTVDICRNFARRTSIEVVVLSHVQRVGFTQNFARALERTTGEVVFLCDQDDVWYESKIERMLEVFRDNPAALIAIHDLAYCDSELRRTGETKLRRLRVLGNPMKHYLTGMATVIRRPLADIALPIPNHPLVTHDTWLHLLGRLLRAKVVVPVVLADFRRHDANASGSVSINSATGSGAREVLGYQVENRSADKLRAIAEMWAAAGDRLRVLGESARPRAGVPHGRLADAARMAGRTERAARDRLAIIRKPQPVRLLAAGSLLLSGGYREFSGLRSALKDVFLSWA